MKRMFIILTIFILNCTQVFASGVSVAPNQAKLEINGAVCAYCAYGMQKGLSDMGCVDRSKGHNGVESDIKNQIVTIHLVEGEKMNLKQMSDSIRKSGYEPRTFHLRVAGLGLIEGDKKFLVDPGKEKLYELTGNVAQQISDQTNYDLQLIIDETAIASLKVDQPPVAKIYSIIEGE